MPRNVRNFWIDLEVDGRSDIGTGPVDKNGGLIATFKMRSDGGIEYALMVVGKARPDGSLLLMVQVPGQGIVYQHETER